MTRFRSFPESGWTFRSILILLALAAAHCGGGSSSSSGPPPPPPTIASVTVNPPTATVTDGNTATFAAIVNGTGNYNSAVTWWASAGTISSSGVFLAPTAVGTATITATSVEDPTKQGSALATVMFSNPTGSAVTVFTTTDDKTQLMSATTGATFAVAPPIGNVVYVDETQKYQQVEGFGAAFTDSAAYLLYEVAKPLQPAQYTTAMSDLFTRNGNGIGLSFMRNPIGASDIARSVYSFDDNGAVNGVGGTPDPTLANFSIAHDQQYIIPVIQQALQLNPQLEIMANPWSPPAWMKNPPTGQTAPTMDGGTLNSTYDSPFANYFVKYIQAYTAAGIPINYISLQNEPLYDTSTNSSPYPGMLMNAPTEATALNQYVLPAFTANNISAKILVYDHNWDSPSYPETVLSSASAANLGQIAGVAWHGYGGPPGAMTTLFNLYPSLGEYETEHSGGTWVADQVKSDFEEITQVMRNYGKSYVKWSLALDENLGPHTGGCGTCTPLVTVNSVTGAITYDVEFYTLGQFSKFVLPGAFRIYSSDADGLVTAAFINPDQSKVLVAYNDSSSSQTFSVQWGDEAFAYTLPALAGATFTWTGTQSSNSPTYTVSADSQIQASSYNSVSDLQTENTSDADGGYDLGYASDGSYAVYKNVDFGTGVSGVSARLACDAANGNCGGTLEFVLDSPGGPPFASVTIPSTGGWQTWQTASGSASGATGVHDLYVVFKAPVSGSTGLGNLNWFRFQ